MPKTLTNTPPTGEGDPSKGDRVRDMFNDIAGRYDFLNAVLSLGVDRGWRTQAIRAALSEQPFKILDVATGTADVALALKRASPSSAVTGVDFAEAMLEVGRRKASARGLDVTLSVADGTALPFADGSFDALTIAYGLRNFVDIDAGLREFRRVLRPGGRLVVLEFPPPPSGVFGRLFRFYFLRVLPAVGGWLSGRPSAYHYLPASVLAFPHPEGLAERMRQAGFRDVKYQLQTLGVSALHQGVAA
jgi:demethylmenaquinone methyltransferase/2-methoxy-6-polyprenyl-1,4-benzoquinol methylase